MFRYVSASEVVWRIYKFPLQQRSTTVQRLSFHCEEKQPAYFYPNAVIEDVLERISNEDSIFMAWLTLNRNNTVGKMVNVLENFYIHKSLPILLGMERISIGLRDVEDFLWGVLTTCVGKWKMNTIFECFST